MRGFATLTCGVVVSMVGCQQVTRIGDGGGACVPAEVQAAFDRSCGGASCHTAGGKEGGLSLDAGQAASAIGRTAVGSPLPLIELGNTEGSYLAQKIMSAPTIRITGARMPEGFSSTNANQVADVNTILSWIAGGEFPDCGSGGTSDTGSTDTGNVGDGLPCDVEEVLATYCRNCHGDPPVGVAFSLTSRDDLLAAAPTNPDVSLAEQAVVRMNDDNAPMPPLPAARATAEEIAILSDWVDAGMPAGDCMPTYDPFAVDPVCTSGKTWTGGNRESPNMRPGHACNDCHDRENEGPIFAVAGTIYPTGHEPDDCNGEGSITVHVTDANGLVAEVKSNGAGNFMLTRGNAPSGFAPPFQIKVSSPVGERAMAMLAPHGDCNVCHTQNGDQNALGRIVAPW